MSVHLAQSGRSKLVTTGLVAAVLRSLVEIGAAIKGFFRASGLVGPGTRAESALETESVATPENPAHVEVEAHAGISPVDDVDQQEIERRRNLVRTLFNDFWRGEDKKPASFAIRLDQAENYLNERLAADGQTWRLDNKTRATLGLPPRTAGKAGFPQYPVTPD